MIDQLKGPGMIARELPAMVRQFHRFGIDLVHEPIPVYSTLHYQNGGVAIKPDGGTSIPGLYVAGEAAGGIHGRSRLMGNSLLDICMFGRRAAAAAWSGIAHSGIPTLAHLDKWKRFRDEAGLSGGVSTPVILPDYTRKISASMPHYSEIEKEEPIIETGGI